MEERIRLYVKHKRTPPRRIIVYRDGVSEGQFNTVVEEEYPQMVKAFETFSTPKQVYRPKLTIVICGKRHHTRFFPTDAQFSDQNGNPKPGTVVDRGVTAVYGECAFRKSFTDVRLTDNPTQILISSFRLTTVFKAQSVPRTITSFAMKSDSRRTCSRILPTRSLTCSLVRRRQSLSPPLLTMPILRANVGVHICTGFCKAFRKVVGLPQVVRRVRRSRSSLLSGRLKRCGMVVLEARSRIRCFICDSRRVSLLFFYDSRPFPSPGA